MARLVSLTWGFLVSGVAAVRPGRELGADAELVPSQTVRQTTRGARPNSSTLVGPITTAHGCSM
jgi:hypothetical protein